MRAERLAEAAQLRARGTELAARIRAEADREAVATVAEAQREAEILRGEREAERSRIFAEAYQRNPEFFEFYRSMLAYEHALDGTGTTLVLSPTSQFFRFFTDATGRPDGPAEASATDTPVLRGSTEADAPRPEPPPAESGGAAEAAPAGGPDGETATEGGSPASGAAPAQ
jgi:membrane protease subunit HflC